MQSTTRPIPVSAGRLELLRALERKALWLSTWMIHNANHLRPSRDGLKVGGHQASCASSATILSALYFAVLRPQDRVAVKPHASPIFHAIHYLLGRQTRQKLEDFRRLGGAQSYPSRTKDTPDVDFSTGSVGLGVAVTAFASLVQDYVHLKGLSDQPEGRMVAIVGDAEMDEGNVFEAMLEGWKHDLRNSWWIIDYNRQSLDSTVSDELWVPIEGMFRSLGWNVVILKYGRDLQDAFDRPGGTGLRHWIDNCPNQLYSALTFKGGAAWREVLLRDLAGDADAVTMVAALDDAELAALMTNLGGHCLESLLTAFDAASHGPAGETPTCFIAYTVKGRGLPFQGHKDNHAGLMNPEQVAAFRAECRVPPGREWEPFAGMEEMEAPLRAFLSQVPYAARADRRCADPALAVPTQLETPLSDRMSTQEGFGKIMGELAKSDSALASRIVTTSPDVTVSTNLGAWVNRRGLFDRLGRQDVFRDQKVVSAQRWAGDGKGQHIELGIAEHNLFLLLAALGLSHDLFGARLLPVGTLYDPFVKRGLDALNYALYQDARFMLVATPSGVTLAAEGGAHQSIITPLIGMGLPNLASFEPAYVDELAVIMRWGFDHMQRDDGGSVYLRLSTRPLEQLQRRMSPDMMQGIIDGGYWLRPPGRGCRLVIAYTGAVAPEAMGALLTLAERDPAVGLLAVTSADRLYQDWLTAQTARREGRRDATSPVERLLSGVPADAGLVTIIDGHPSALSWLGGVRRLAVAALGISQFGQSTDVDDGYRLHGLDQQAILAAARELLDRR